MRKPLLRPLQVAALCTCDALVMFPPSKIRRAFSASKATPGGIVPVTKVSATACCGIRLLRPRLHVSATASQLPPQISGLNPLFRSRCISLNPLSLDTRRGKISKEYPPVSERSARRNYKRELFIVNCALTWYVPSTQSIAAGDSHSVNSNVVCIRRRRSLLIINRIAFRIREVRSRRRLPP